MFLTFCIAIKISSRCKLLNYLCQILIKGESYYVSWSYEVWKYEPIVKHIKSLKDVIDIFLNIQWHQWAHNKHWFSNCCIFKMENLWKITLTLCWPHCLQLKQEIEDHRGHVNTLIFEEDGGKMYSGDSAGNVLIFNVFVGEQEPKLGNNPTNPCTVTCTLYINPQTQCAECWETSNNGLGSISVILSLKLSEVNLRLSCFWK